MGADEGKDSEDDAEERNAERSFVFFSSEEETKEPWLPLLLSLGDIMCWIQIRINCTMQTNKHKDDNTK